MNTYMYRGRECYIIKVCRKRVILGVVNDDSLWGCNYHQTIIKNLPFLASVQFKRELRQNKW